jgi:hypothetical protein
MRKLLQILPHLSELAVDGGGSALNTSADDAIVSWWGDIRLAGSGSRN